MSAESQKLTFITSRIEPTASLDLLPQTCAIALVEFNETISPEAAAVCLGPHPHSMTQKSTTYLFLHHFFYFPPSTAGPKTDRIRVF